jgi:hypothetical protein
MHPSKLQKNRSFRPQKNGGFPQEHAASHPDAITRVDLRPRLRLR